MGILDEESDKKLNSILLVLTVEESNQLISYLRR
jgi:hypothetical protein